MCRSVLEGYIYLLLRCAILAPHQAKYYIIISDTLIFLNQKLIAHHSRPSRDLTISLYETARPLR